MKKIFFLLFLVLVLSCDIKMPSSELNMASPKNMNSKKTALIGTWKLSGGDTLIFRVDGTFVWTSKASTEKGRYIINGAIVSFVKKNGKGRTEQFFVKGNTLLLRPTYYKSKIGMRKFQR